MVERERKKVAKLERKMQIGTLDCEVNTLLFEKKLGQKENIIYSTGVN